MNPDKTEQLIEQIYDLLLYPKKTNDFIGLWEKYIVELAESQGELRNAHDRTETLSISEGLERHFARVYAILERQGRKRHIGDAQATSSPNLIFRFDLQGNVVECNISGMENLKAVQKDTDLADCFTADDRESWLEFLRLSKRAPLLEQLSIFALADGGSLLAFNRRNESTGRVQILVNELVIAWSKPLRRLLTNHFGLTNSELELAELLTLHGSLDKATQAVAKSKNTLRNQLGSIFEKLNVNSQAAVTQMLAVLAQFCGTVGIELHAPQNNVLLGEQLLVDVSNGKVPVHFHGPTNGHPVLFIHGMLDGVAMNQRIVSALWKQDLRLICPIRPNFGRAQSIEAVTETHRIFARQIREVAEQLEVHDAILLGHMSGGAFGFAASPYLGNRILGLVNISCGAPILSTRQFAKLSKRQKAFAYTARFAPKMLPALMRIGVAQIDSSEIGALMFDMYPKDSPDRYLLQDDDIAAVILDGYRFAVAQGYNGFYGDALLVTSDWSNLVRGNDKPVLLMHGAHDPAACFDAVSEFAINEGFEIRKYHADGQLLLYGKPNEVFNEVRSFLDSLTT